ncbi:MAG TPA: LysR family transcriptional regulator [Labilithrix sp.]|nr:LysR family transcriptional regulator [Labilithrix sp.]
MMDLNDIAVFARVARERSFTRAAKSLGMPKSTVSERVARLEAKLGVRLLERTTRSLRLTVSGEAYFARVVRVVQELEEAEAAVTAAHKLPRGVLRVASPLLFAQVFLADVVSEYLTRFPEVHVELIVADRSFDILEEKLDVAVHVLGAMDAQHVARKLAIGDRRCVASADYVERRGLPATPSDLVDHGCVVVGPSRAATWTFEADGHTRAVAVLGRYAVTSIELAYRATLAGHGIAVVPAFLCAHDLAAGRLVRVLPAWSPGEVSIHLVYPSHRHLPARVRTFVDLVVERLPTFPLRAGPVS